MIKVEFTGKNMKDILIGIESFLEGIDDDGDFASDEDDEFEADGDDDETNETDASKLDEIIAGAVGKAVAQHIIHEASSQKRKQ